MATSTSASASRVSDASSAPGAALGRAGQPEGAAREGEAAEPRERAPVARRGEREERVLRRRTGRGIGWSDLWAAQDAISSPLTAAAAVSPRATTGLGAPTRSRYRSSYARGRAFPVEARRHRGRLHAAPTVVVVVGDARPSQRRGQCGRLRGREQEARAAVVDRVDQPAGGARHRQGAVAHGDQLREAAGLEAGGHDQYVGARVDAARQASS
jgi:hypothetical protein